VRSAAELDEAFAADFRLMVDVGAGVTGSLQFAKLCAIYLTPLQWRALNHEASRLVFVT
jgi:hypothetical protein